MNMIQTIIMSELLKILSLLFLKFVLTKAGFLGSNNASNNRKYNSKLPSLLQEMMTNMNSNQDSTVLGGNMVSMQNHQHNEAMSALVTGLIQLAFTILGCWVVKQTVNSLAQNVKTTLFDSKNQNLPTNVTKFLLPNSTLNTYELQILEDALILPSMLNFEFESIGGLNLIKESLEELADDFLATQSFDHTLYQPIAGLLLFGPPGCGKSSLAKSFCKRAHVPMISITPSNLLRKYVGETSQLMKAVFSLSKKLEPCIIFIDEMDSMFRSRVEDDHPVLRNLQTEFMQLWDDLVSNKKKVMVIGATNRDDELDAAVRRRFERTFFIGLPDQNSRSEIFKKILDGVKTKDDFDYILCGRYTEGYSASDIVALCKSALAIPLREQRIKMRQATKASSILNRNNNDMKSLKLRPLSVSDIEHVLKTFNHSSNLNKRKPPFYNDILQPKKSTESPSSSSYRSDSNSGGNPIIDDDSQRFWNPKTDDDNNSDQDDDDND